MNILLIYLNRSHQEAISTGLGYISGWLKVKNKNCNIKLFDFTWGATKQECYDFIKKIQPKLIGITLTTLDFNFCKDLIKGIRNINNSLIILGGTHPTVAPEESIKYADIICIGEGEKSLQILIEKLEKNEDYSKINNLWIRKGTQIIKNDLCDLIEDLDSYECDRELFNIKKYLKARNFVMDVYAGRGCPYNCSYCINHVQRELYKGKGTYVRMRSPRNIIDEINKLRLKYSIKKISFPDDTLTSNKRWLLNFCELYQKEIRLPFVCNARVENINEDVCKALKKANCIALKIGIESGSEKIRKEVLNRHMSNSQIIKAFELCRKYGINTQSYNMVGIPYETREDMLRTIELNRRVQPTEVSTTIWHPFPGTKLYNQVKEKGWIADSKIEDYKSGSIMKYEYISAKDIKKIRDKFAFNVYIKFDILKAVRTLIQGVFFNIYRNLQTNLPLTLRSIIQKIANIS